jgi:hypothetical protein
MSKRISKEELSDEDIQSILEDFSNLTEEQRKERLIGEGAYKQTYSVPDKNFVIKKPYSQGVAINDMAKEYAINKKLRDKMDLELPILVTQKSDDKITPYHIQRRITPLENVTTEKIKSVKSSPEIKSLENAIANLRSQMNEADKSRNASLDAKDFETAEINRQKFLKSYDELMELQLKLQNQLNEKIKKPERDFLDKIYKKMMDKGIAGADVHSGNVTPEGKIFDLGSWTGYDYNNDAKNKALIEARKKIVDRTIDNPMMKGKYRILRSLLPMVGKGLLAGAAGAASLAAEASDIEGEGSLQEEQQLERDKASAKLKKSIGPDAFNKFQENIRYMSPQNLIDPDYDKPKFNTIRKKIKE